MGPILNLSDLQCFVLVYEQRSFSRAANLLDTAQSQVSARIQRLERFAGIPLFTRLPHGITPNRKGELLYEHAKRVLSNITELETAVRNTTSPGRVPETCRQRGAVGDAVHASAQWSGIES